MLHEQILNFVNRSTCEQLLNCHPHDILQCGAALKEHQISPEKWEIIRARVTILAGTQITSNLK